MSQIGPFVSEFCRWAGENGLPENRRARLASGLRRAIVVVLPERDGNAEVIIRPLDNSYSLSSSYESEEIWLYHATHNKLVSGVVAPAWRSGWRRISRDEDVADTISDFFHFAAQYVARSRVVNLIGAIALTHGRACEFRYAGLQFFGIGPNTPFPTVQAARLTALQTEDYAIGNAPRQNSRKQAEFEKWVRAINGLDPYIHRAIYQYWKATALIESHFWEEAITALDGVTSIAAQFAQQRLGAGSNARSSMGSLLGLSIKDREDLNHLYNLRCDFGAHPSRSKWWDFSEIYDQELDFLMGASKRLVWRLCKAEMKNRVVEPSPKVWSNWFSENALMILESVWFSHIR
jgi:hypothetical protein